MAKLSVAVVYGSRSPEHEVSIITALQVMQNLAPDKYTVIPIYISKNGHWFLGDASFLKPETYKNLDKITLNRPKLLIDAPKNVPRVIW